MTIRLFRRKSGTARPATQERPTETQATTSEPAKRRSRGRRGGSRAKKDSAAAPTPAVEAPSAQQSSETLAAQRSGRTRRGRRGGARRNKGTQKASESPQSATASAAPAAPPAVRRIDGARPATLEELMETQLAVLQSLQGSLAAIESRLTSLAQTGAERPRIGIFVDVPNVMYAAERLKIKLDYGKLLDLLVRGRELVRASAYAPISDDPQEPLATQKFVQPFVGHGYSLVTKPLKRYADGSIKGNFDVELAIDVLTMSDRLDIVVIVSGDSDFRRVVELIASKGVRVEVAAFGDSASFELRAAADEYIDIKEHLAEIRAK